MLSLLLFSQFSLLFLSANSQQCDAPGGSGCLCRCACLNTTTAPPVGPTTVPNTNCSICPTGAPTNGTGGNSTLAGLCEQGLASIDQLFGTNTLYLLFLALYILLSNLLYPILYDVLFGDNSDQVVLQLTNVLCYLVGVLLLLLKSLGLLGLFGPGNLLTILFG